MIREGDEIFDMIAHRRDLLDATAGSARLHEIVNGEFVFHAVCDRTSEGLQPVFQVAQRMVSPLFTATGAE